MEKMTSIENHIELRHEDLQGNVFLWQGFTKQTLGKSTHQSVGEIGLEAFSPS
jgi:hypothetical protein